MSLAVTNPDAVPLTRVWLRLWGNGPHGCSAPRRPRSPPSRAPRRGAPAVRCTAVPLDLAPALAPGARGTVELDVDIRAPDDFDRFGEGGHRLALFSNALPALAHREGGRWRLDRYFHSGEAWTYPAADFAGPARPARGRGRGGARRARRPAASAALGRGPRLLVGRGDAPAPAAGAGRRAWTSRSGRRGGAARAPLRIGGPLRGRRRADALHPRAGRGRACPSSCGASARTAGRTCRSCSPTPPGMEHTGLIMTPPDDLVDQPRAGARVVVRADRRRPGRRSVARRGLRHLRGVARAQAPRRPAGAPGASGGS